jgi:hypothetical protein
MHEPSLTVGLLPRTRSPRQPAEKETKEMLAYVFWHWPRPEVDRAAYEQDLREFHRTLLGERPAGFHYSSVFRISEAPWLPIKGTAYEDWYLTEDSAALDVLNHAAVNNRSQQPHDRAAQRAAGGTAGLYLFRHGQIDFDHARFAMWFSKPAGMSYEDFYASLTNVTDKNGVALWGRQMVLGPTPEFCLLTPQKISLDKDLHATTLVLDPVWARNE